MKSYDLDGAVGFWLHLGFNRLRARSGEHMAALATPVTPEQWAVMVRLWQADDRSQVELAEATFRDKAAVTRLVDALEAKGLVRRQRDPADRRRQRVLLTEAGRAAEAELVPAVRAWVRHCFRDIPPDELETTVRVLRRLHGNLDRAE